MVLEGIIEKTTHKAFCATWFADLSSIVLSEPPQWFEQNFQNPLFSIGFGVTSISLIAGVYARITAPKDIGFEGNKLVDSGTYGVVRHPIYASIRAMQTGMTLMNPTYANIALLLAVYAATEIQARVEERKLTAVYSEKFTDYKNRVPGWIPKIRIPYLSKNANASGS